MGSCREARRKSMGRRLSGSTHVQKYAIAVDIHKPVLKIIVATKIRQYLDR